MMRSPRVQAYIDALVRMIHERGFTVVSVVLFGSAATGGFIDAVSDVDLILVLSDDADQTETALLRRQVEDLEYLHGLRDASATRQGLLDAFVRKLTANVRSFFICSRSDLLSGNPARLLDISPVQALFVDRGVIPGILRSAVTVWGEDLLEQVPMPAIRRFDVFKSLSGFCNQALLCAVVYPFVPSATAFAMATLKRSIHSCYFCYHLHSARLEEEIEFFQKLLGPNRTLARLAALRLQYRHSFAFVLSCLPTLLRLHLRTASDNTFPRTVLAA